MLCLYSDDVYTVAILFSYLGSDAVNLVMSHLSLEGSRMVGARHDYLFILQRELLETTEAKLLQYFWFKIITIFNLKL